MSRLTERIDTFNKVYTLYCSMRNAYLTEINNMTKLALIHSFELVIEFSLKFLKEYLGKTNIKVYTPLKVIKKALTKNIIKNEQIWLDMIKYKNLTFLECNSATTNQILEKISSSYFIELKNFYESLEVIIK